MTRSGHQSRTAQSFCVPKAEIAAKGYELSLNRYKELEQEETHATPAHIISGLRELEKEISRGLTELEEMLRMRTVTLSSLVKDARSGFASGKDDPGGIVQVRMNNITTEGRLNWEK